MEDRETGVNDILTASGGFCFPISPVFDFFDLKPWTRPDPNPMPRFAPLWSELPMLRLRSKVAVYRRRIRAALKILRGEDDQLYADYNDYDD